MFDFFYREDKLAFFINIYNALVIHGNIERGTPTNTYQRYKFFSTVSYNIGGQNFTLNDIENGILRGNKPRLLESNFKELRFIKNYFELNE